MPGMADRGGHRPLQDGPTRCLLRRMDLLMRIWRGLACPALFMTGGDEPNSTPEMSEGGWHGIAPHGRAVIVEGAAHMMPHDACGDR